MPGTKGQLPEPSGYLIEDAPALGPLADDPESPPRRIEAFPIINGVATPQWVKLPHRRITTDLQVLALPAGARKLALYDPTGKPVFANIRAGAMVRKRILFVSEGFGDDKKVQFFDSCESMAEKLLETEPFKKAKSAIQIDGLFLPLRGGAVVDIGCSRDAADLAKLKPTLFGTQSCLDSRTDRLWGGDEARVRHLVSNAMATENRGAIQSFDLLATLINSASYGGAGSSGPETLKPRMAWATTGDPLSFNILVHELGHAFGLQDEYELEQAEPAKPWRNISDHRIPRETPWRGLVNVANDVLTCPSGTTWTGRRDTVGTFEGAGYKKTKRFRPANVCMMRDVVSDFCPVCTDHIRASIDSDFVGRVGEEG